MVDNKKEQERAEQKNGLTQYGSFIKEIKDLIYRRQYEAMKKVNTELIQLYWEIGEEIERQQREQGWDICCRGFGWGASKRVSRC